MDRSPEIAIKDEGELATHLKDLNVSEKMKLAPLLHGRKASTYLRIFTDDDQGTNENNKTEIQKRHSVVDVDPHTPESKVFSNKTHHESHCHNPLDAFKVFKSSSSAQHHHVPRRNSASICDTLSRYRTSARPPNNEPPNTLGHKPKKSHTPAKPILKSSLSEELQLYREGVSSKSVAVKNPKLTFEQRKETGKQSTDNQNQALSLKPISSATYYPHKSKRQDEPDFTSASTPLSTIGTPISTPESLIGTTDLEDSDKTIVDDDDDYYDDDDDKDNDEEFPLAVELQPFTDKVGGHTAIFRFSKRAVCKALVNRENKWYENIELQYQELLQFMPRYIGVLNVRQHFNSKEEFLEEVARGKEAKRRKKELQMRQNQVQENSRTYEEGQDEVPCNEALKPTQSVPITAEHGVEKEPPLHALPEVVLDDNKHIIPDSLWFKYSHSPNSAPSDSYLSSHSPEEQPVNSKFCSGSTMVNTKLQELVLQEVFAPIKRKAQKRHTSSSYQKKSRSSSVSSTNSVDGRPPTQPMIRRASTSIESKKGSQSTSPLLKNSLHTSITNSVDSHTSVIDLKQFHKRKLAQEKLEDEKVNELKQHCDIPKRNLEEDVFEMEEDTVEAPPKEGDHESVSFEENSHTIVSKFILLEDLTRKLNKACVLDLKMGTRQYGVDAKKSKQVSQREKCRKTTSRKLGVRICGLKIWNQTYYITRDKYFGRRVRIGWQFARVLARFMYDGSTIASILNQIPRLVKQLDTLYSEVLKLKGYRLYGASLLLIYDGNNTANKRCRVKVNLIDFAQCITKDDIIQSYDSFKIPPLSPESEDRGFLRGVRSLRFYSMTIWNHLTNDAALCFDDELTQFLQEHQDTVNRPWDWLDEFDRESEFNYNDPESELRKKWRKYELIFDVEPRYMDDAEVSE